MLEIPALSVPEWEANLSRGKSDYSGGFFWQRVATEGYAIGELFLSELYNQGLVAEDKRIITSFPDYPFWNKERQAMSHEVIYRVGSPEDLAAHRMRDHIYEPLSDVLDLWEKFLSTKKDRLKYLEFARQYGLLLNEIPFEKGVIPYTDPQANLIGGNIVNDWDKIYDRLESISRIWMCCTNALSKNEEVRLINLAYLKDSFEFGEDSVFFRYLVGEMNWGDRMDLNKIPNSKVDKLVTIAQSFIKMWVNEKLKASVDMSMEWDWTTERSDPKFKIFQRPHNLLGAMWMQFTQTISRGGEFRRCVVCDGIFRVGSQKTKKYCGDACKQKPYNDKVAAKKKALPSSATPVPQPNP